MKWMKRVLATLTATAAAVTMCLGASAGDLSKAQLQTLLDDNKDMLGLTMEQRLEDYDYLWQTLETSYPFLGVVERAGVDLNAVREKYRQFLEENDSDFALYMTVNDLAYQMMGQGHFAFFSPSWYDGMRAAYEEFLELGDPAWLEHFQPWLDVILGDGSVEAYEKSAGAEQQFFGMLDNVISGDDSEAPPNVEARLLSGSTAYLKVRQMLTDYESDRAVIERLYERAKDCENLIIDITENGGGNDAYWQNLLVAPLIDKPVTLSGFMGFSLSENNRPYLRSILDSGKARPISELTLPLLHKDDRARLTHYIRDTVTLAPAIPGKKAFDGKIWLLTGPQVYSSSESFAYFSRHTGFATLVGSTTGGDGFGVDPIYCVLPNSRYIIRYSMLYTMNPDGRSNEEYGTSPHITQRRDETALDACLRAIAREG